MKGKVNSLTVSELQWRQDIHQLTFWYINELLE